MALAKLANQVLAVMLPVQPRIPEINALLLTMIVPAIIVSVRMDIVVEQAHHAKQQGNQALVQQPALVKREADVRPEVACLLAMLGTILKVLTVLVPA
jgi:hypothetical protein